MGIDIKNIQHTNKIIDEIINIIKEEQLKGKLPQNGPFKVVGQKFCHKLGAAGAVVNGNPQVATAYHVNTCCP